ncbi:hypothetical protein [Sulfoacidibacillus thermotolerans]|uniref:Uncharacterized protein n=1 Tax=Sulfoacidibacillus thermotolerans TaxID=1765684 RepID=A0A2U3D7P0_SULT2|nr:hypothetical protein [Sulfoacidibacillus thermotolerans]PWI57289.1 hypothetical protein BM613_09335 [Sulfoacidibacillus thermotolerans]
MDEVKELQLQQQRLLHAWLDAVNGEARFLILKELRAVEQELGEQVRQGRMEKQEFQAFAVFHH